MAARPEDFDGLTEEEFELLRRQAEAFRRRRRLRLAGKPLELPIWPGMIIGKLTRDEIYDDVG